MGPRRARCRREDSLILLRYNEQKDYAHTKSGVKRPLVIKSSPKLVPVTHIRTNMRTAGMSRERYFHLLEKVK